MGLYLFVILSPLLLASLSSMNKNGHIENDLKNRKDIAYCCYWFGFIITFMFLAFRGDFTSDYVGYKNLFDFFGRFSIKEIFEYQYGQEKGFVFLNRAVSIFTDKSFYSIVIVAFVTVFLFYKAMLLYSTNVWMSAFLFIGIGSYYPAFNISRNILAVAICFVASKYLFERKIFMYFLSVGIAATFHKTALVMVPAYFILNMNITKKNMFILTTIAILGWAYIEKIINVTRIYFYRHYFEGAYGMAGYSYKNVVIPLLVIIFIIIHFRKMQRNDPIERACLNATFLFFIFAIYGMKIQMLQRFSEYFAPYVTILIPMVLTKIKDNNLKIVYCVCIFGLVIAYNMVALKGTGYDPYYFFWQNAMR